MQHSLKIYDAHIITQLLTKVNFFHKVGTIYSEMCNFEHTIATKRNKKTRSAHCVCTLTAHCYSSVISNPYPATTCFKVSMYNLAADDRPVREFSIQPISMSSSVFNGTAVMLPLLISLPSTPLDMV